MNIHITTWMLAAGLLLAAPLPAQVQVTASQAATGTSGKVEVTAAMEGTGPQPEWRWSVTPAWAGVILLANPTESGNAIYCAPPFLLESERVAIQATPAHSSTSGHTSLIVHADGAMRDLRRIIADYLGHDPLVPRKKLLAGLPKVASGEQKVPEEGPDPYDGSPPGEVEQGFRSLTEAAWGRTFTPGTGRNAQFCYISHLAFAGDHPNLAIRGKWLVVDAGSNQIAVVDNEGKASPWLGGPDKPEAPVTSPIRFRDGRNQEARFHRPMHLAVRPSGSGLPWEAVIVDTGNNAIRKVDAQGNVTTLSGLHSHRPAEMELRDLWKHGTHHGEDYQVHDATFNHPVAAAYGPDGAILVAELHCIRKIKDKTVTTIAGHARRANRPFGSLSFDGRREEAGFKSIRAMDFDPGTGLLYVNDDGTLRLVALDGEARSKPFKCEGMLSIFRGSLAFLRKDDVPRSGLDHFAVMKLDGTWRSLELAPQSGGGPAGAALLEGNDLPHNAELPGRLRHMALDPDGRFLQAINQGDGGSFRESNAYLVILEVEDPAKWADF